MRNYTKYRIVKEQGKYYVEIPLLWIFWERLWISEVVPVNNGFYTEYKHKLRYREFDSISSAREFAEANKYRVFKQD